MNKPVPWNINGVGFDAREAARDAARRQGKSLGEWLHGVIADHATDQGVDERELAGHQRIEAVTSKLERLSAKHPDQRSGERRPRSNRSDDLAQWREDRDEERDDEPLRPRGAVEPRRRREAPGFDAEAMLEDAIDVMDRRARRTERHTEDALRSFSKMLERNEAQRDRERQSVTALADKLSSIETRLSDRLAPSDDNPIKGALARLEARLDAIGRRGAAEAAALKPAIGKASDRSEPLHRLEEKLNSVLEAVNGRSGAATSPLAYAAADAARPPKDRRLGDAIAEIARRQQALDPDGEPQTLRQVIGRRRDMPRQPVSRPVEEQREQPPFVAMQGEIAALASKIEDLRRDVVVERETRRQPPIDLDGLRAEISNMSGMLRDLAPRADVSNLEDSVRHLAERIDSSHERGLREALRPVESMVGDLRRSIPAIDSRQAIGGLENELRTIGGKIGELHGGGVEPAAVARIQDQMREIRDLIMTTAAKPLAVEHIEQQIASLGERLDRQTRQPGIGQDLGRAAEELRAAIANPPGAAAFSNIETRLEALSTKIDRAVAAGPQNLAAKNHALEALVRDLSRKMEAAQAPGAGDQAFDALQQQIALLSARFERTDSGLAKLGTIERSMRDLFAHLDETRASVETSAARAAREVLRIAMEEGQAASEHGAVTSLTAMKALQDEAEARTSSTLSAVHETLEKVVDRLAVMETNIADVRGRSEPPRGAALKVAMPKPAQAAPSPASSTPPSARPGAPAPANSGTPKSGAANAATRRPSDIALGVPDPFLDQVLGDLGRRSSDKAPGAARGTPIDLDDMGARADFIAAARRAAKAAQSDPSVTELTKPSESRADSPTRAGLIEQSRAYVARHKRPVLISMAALFVIVGTMALMQRIGLGGDTQMADVAPPARIAQNIERAPRPRARATDDLSPSALPKATQAIAARIPGSDPIQTGSIPSLPSFAAGAGAPPPPRPTLPAGLTTMAEAGDGGAEYVLGTQYAEGRATPRDFKTAARWYQKAADQGLAPAQYRLAALYEKGLGVTQDKVKARTLYLEAAEAGNPRAMHNLAVLLADGDGKPDYDGAATWFRKAAQFGIHDSQYNLAILLARGLGVQQSLVQSYQWFAIAATQNDADAAKKRDEVGSKLAANDLAVAKALAGAFRPRIADVAATEVQPPPGGWDGAAAPTPLNSARHKISSL